MKVYTSKIVADWLGLTERRVRQLRDEGIIKEIKPGLYDLHATVIKYINYLRGVGEVSLQTERMKLTAEKRIAAEMDNAARRGELHSTQDIEAGVKTMCLNIRSRFLAMPAKLSPALTAAGDNQAEIFDILKSAIDEALEELSDYRVALALEGGMYEDEEWQYREERKDDKDTKENKDDKKDQGSRRNKRAGKDSKSSESNG